MTNTGTPGGTGEPTIGDEGHGIAQPHAHDGGGGVQHFPHTGAALGAFVADDYHVAGVDVPRIDGGLSLFLGFKDPGGAFVHQHFGKHRAALDHAALRSQIAPEHGDAAGGGVGILHGADDGGVVIDGIYNVFTQRLAGDRHDGGVQQILLGQLFQHRVHAAGGVQVLHIGGAGGGQMAQVRGHCADFVSHVQIEVHAALIGDGGQVEHGVGGAAQGHVSSQGVADGGGGHDVPGPDVAAHQFHNLHTGVLGKLNSRGVHRRDGAVALQTHAKNLRQAVHGVGGVHTGAGAAGGAGVLFAVGEPLLVNFSSGVSADSLEHTGKAGFFAVYPACQHGAAADENGGNVYTGGSHEQTRHVLVAVGHHDHAVKAVGFQHGFGGVGDQVTGDQRILHTFMAHGDAVTDGDGGENDGGAAGHGNAQLHGIHDFIEVHVTGDDLIVGADHGNQGALLLLFRQA